MREARTVEAVALGGRFVLSWLFILAGVTKFVDLDRFEDVVRDYRVLPTRLVRPMARLLPPMEVAAGTLIGAGVAVTAAGALLTVLLLAFAMVMTVNLVRGRSIDCGCLGGLGSSRITWIAVVRNVILALLAAMVAAVAPAELALPVFGPRATATMLSASDAVAVLFTTMGALAAAALLIEGLRVRARLPSGGE